MTWYMNIGTLIKEQIRKHWTLPNVEPASVIKYSLLVLIFALAIMIRLFSVILYEPMLKAYDPWYQYRVTEHIAHHGFASFFTWHDTKSWYPWGRNISTSTYPGTAFTTVFIYFILKSVGIEINLFILCVVFPAFCGGLACLAMYFLGSELDGSRTGLFASFLLAFCPAYISRTMAGFYDNEALGILLIITTLLFFLKGLKQNSLIYSIFAGLSLGYLGASWGAYVYILVLLPLVTLLLIFFKKYSLRLFTTYSLTILIAVFIILQVPRVGLHSIRSFTFVVPLGVLGLLLVFELMRWANHSLKMSVRAIYLSSLVIFGVLASAAVYYLVHTGILSIEQITGPFKTMVDPTERPPLVESVSEHIPLSWGQLFFNLDILVFLLPVGIFYGFRRFREDDIVLMTFAILSLYFSASLVRLLLIVAPAACLFGAYGLVNVLRPFARELARARTGIKGIITRRRGRITPAIPPDYSVFVIVFIGFILTMYIWHGTDVAFKYFSSSDMILKGQTREGAPLEFHDWQEGMQWLRDNTPEDAVVLSWWDYGYWIETLGNRTTLCDGATFNGTQIGWVGAALMLPPENSSKILKQLGADYILVYFMGGVHGTGGDEGKWTWMVQIAEQYVANETGIKYSDYFDEETGEAKEPYYESLLYQLLFYNSPTYPRGRQPVFSLPTIVEHAYSTEYIMVRIYKINYDAEIEAPKVEGESEPVFFSSLMPLEMTIYEEVERK